MVTGGNGFLGKHVLSEVEGNVVRKLNERGADVFVADIDPSAESTLSRAEGLRVDLRRLEDTLCGRALSDSKPQTHGMAVGDFHSHVPARASVVIHLAARVGGIPLHCPVRSAQGLRASGTNVGANSEHPAEFFGACPELAEGTILRHGEPRSESNRQDRPDDTCTRCFAV